MRRAQGWYYDLNDNFMLIELALAKEDGVIKIGDDKVAFINYPGAALFKDMKLYTEYQKLEGENQAYSYKAYIYTLLTAPKSSKQYQLAATGWSKDKVTLYDDSTNEGFVTRQK